MKLYGLKNCDTCRKASKMLQGAGFDVALIDVRTDGVSGVELAQFYSVFGTALLNTRSTTWRGLDAAEREKEPLTLLADYPALMKRPVIEHDGELTLGWAKNVQDKYL